MSRVEKVVPHAPDSGGDRAHHHTLGSPIAFRPSPLDSLPIAQVRQDVLADHRVVSREMDPASLAAYKMLRTRLLHRIRDRNCTSLAITSCAAGDGKTTTAINLSLSLSEEINQRVVLVDLDLRRPGLHEFFGLAPKAGLTEYLLGEADLSAVLLRPAERLFVVPTITPMWNSSENIHAPRMQLFIEKIRALDPAAIVVYDLPPLLASDDFFAFSPQVDGFLLVVADGKTPKSALLEAWEMLDTDKLLGVMLNMSDARLKPYYYY